MHGTFRINFARESIRLHASANVVVVTYWLASIFVYTSKWWDAVIYDLTVDARNNCMNIRNSIQCIVVRHHFNIMLNFGDVSTISCEFHFPKLVCNAMHESMSITDQRAHTHIHAYTVSNTMGNCIRISRWSRMLILYLAQCVDSLDHQSTQIQNINYNKYTYIVYVSYVCVCAADSMKLTWRDCYAIRLWQTDENEIISCTSTSLLLWNRYV